MTNTDMFLEVAKSIQDTSATGTRYGKLFALRDLLSEIETLKDIDTATKLKIKILIEGKINGWDVYWGHYDNDFDEFNGKLEKICRDELMKQFRKSTKEGQELDKLDDYARNLLLTLSYPNLTAKAVDLNEALKNGSSMLTIALNPNTLKRLEN